MKKILLGTVFGFVCLGMPVCVYAQENETQPTAIVDEMPSEEVQANSQEITDGAEPLEEETLKEAEMPTEDKALLETVWELFAPEYKGVARKEFVQKDGNDYVVTLPTAEKQKIRCVRVEDFDGHAQYQVELSNIPVLSTLLGRVQTTGLKNTVRFVPEFGVVSYQNTMAQEIKSDNGLSFSDLSVQRNIKEKADKKIDVETKGSLNRFLFSVPPYLTLSIAGIEGKSELENTHLADEVLMSLDAQKGSCETEIKGLEFESMLFPVEKASLNLKTQMEYVNKNDVYEGEVDIAVSDIRFVLKDKGLESKVPTYVDLETSADGFKKADVLKVYEALTEASLEPGNQRLAIAVIEELNKATLNLTQDIEKLAFGNENYDIVLSGKAQNFETYVDFDGKLRVRGFDFISPEPVEMDEETCEKEKKAMQELMAQSSKESFSLDYIARFEKQREVVQNACVAKENILDDLRPFIKTAQKETDDKGREVLVFDIRTNEEGVFINGEKSEKISLAKEE